MDNNLRTKNIILEQGFAQFSQNGMRQFTVESLATNLGMSKKTIYKFFPTKEILIEKVIGNFTGSIKKKFMTVVESDDDPINKFNSVMEFLRKKIGYIKMENLAEVKIRYPQIWNNIEDFRLEMVRYITTIFEEAQDKGFANPELNMDVVAIIYINIINATFQPKFFLKNNLAPVDTIKTFVKMVTEGIFIYKEDANNNDFIWE